MNIIYLKNRLATRSLYKMLVLSFSFTFAILLALLLVLDQFFTTIPLSLATMKPHQPYLLAFIAVIYIAVIPGVLALVHRVLALVPGLRVFFALKPLYLWRYWLLNFLFILLMSLAQAIPRILQGIEALNAREPAASGWAYVLLVTYPLLWALLHATLNTLPVLLLRKTGRLAATG